MTLQSTVSVAPLEPREAGFTLSPATMCYLIRMSVGERQRRLAMAIIRIVIRPWEQRGGKVNHPKEGMVNHQPLLHCLDTMRVLMLQRVSKKTGATVGLLSLETK